MQEQAHPAFESMPFCELCDEMWHLHSCAASGDWKATLEILK